MIQVHDVYVTAMEFTSFSLKSTVLEEQFYQVAQEFEKTLASLNKVVFHSVVKNDKGLFADVLLVEHFADLAFIHKALTNLPQAQAYFELIAPSSVEMKLMQIHKPKVIVPANFTCIELGVFALKDATASNALLTSSDEIEKKYLATFDNTQEHFIGEIAPNSYAEVTFGQSLGDTQTICYGYLQNQYCLPMLDLCEPSSMQFDFWNIVQ